MRIGTLQSYKERMERVLTYIQENLDQHLPLETLAGIACFSAFHFHRIFRGMVGESVKEHVRRLRLEQAAQRLKHGNQPVIDIALEAGYESHEAFSRAFKAKCGMSPTGFRRMEDVSFPVKTGFPHAELQSSQPMAFPFTGGIMKVKIKQIKAMRVAYMRHHGPYATCGETWDRFLPLLGKRGLLGGEATILGVAHDDPGATAPEEIRYDACVVVDPSFEPEDGVRVQVIQGGEYAVTTHEGAYDKLGETYAALCGRWLPQSGRELRPCPCFEIYFNDPESTEPEDLITDVHLPLQSK